MKLSINILAGVTTAKVEGTRNEVANGLKFALNFVRTNEGPVAHAESDAGSVTMGVLPESPAPVGTAGVVYRNKAGKRFTMEELARIAESITDSDIVSLTAANMTAGDSVRVLNADGSTAFTGLFLGVCRDKRLAVRVADGGIEIFHINAVRPEVSISKAKFAIPTAPVTADGYYIPVFDCNRDPDAFGTKFITDDIPVAILIRQKSVYIQVANAYTVNGKSNISVNRMVEFSEFGLRRTNITQDAGNGKFTITANVDIGRFTTAVERAKQIQAHLNS